MRVLKRSIAALLCLVMVVTMQPWELLAAEQQTEAAEKVTETGTTETETETTETETEIKKTETEIQPKSETGSKAETGMETGIQARTETGTEAEVQTENVAEVSTETAGNTQNSEQLLLNYLLLGSSSVQTPGEQYVLASVGEETQQFESAELIYVNTSTQEQYRQEAELTDGNVLLFRMAFSEASQAGSYELTGIAYRTKDTEAVIQLSETGIQARFGVDEEVATQPDALVLDEDESDVEAVITNADGETLTEEQFAEAMTGAQSGIDGGTAVQSTGVKKRVIVLDAGHGGTDGGASYFGYKESVLTLKIAAYCKQELETYNGVKVYMTRTTDETMGATQVASLDERVRRAKEYNADLLVSFHLNATGTGSASGVEVYYPNANYNQLIHNSGKGLAENILKQLVALGLKDRGIKIWNCSEDKYPDGTLADYLGLIRRSKLAGFPCVLIEHAYIDNSGDVTSFLNTDDKLKKVGIADATGIAAYYKLSKKSGDMKLKQASITSVKSSASGSIQLKWDVLDNADAYQIYRSTSADGEYTKVAETEEEVYEDTGLKTGVAYYYKVRGKADVNGKAVYGSFSDAKAGKSAAATSILGIRSQKDGTLALSWKKAAGTYRYQVYRSTKKNSGYKKIATVSGTTYIDRKISVGTRYYYKIRTVNRYNKVKGYGSYSAAKYGVCVGRTSITDVQTQTSESLTVSWKKVSGATGYYVYRSTKKNSGYKLVKKLSGGSVLNYTDNNLTVGKTYYYKIQVQNRSGKNRGVGALSKAASGKTIESTNIIYTQSLSSGGLKLAWNKKKNADGYAVARATSKNGSYKVIRKISSAKTTSYTDTSAQAGKRYYYKVAVVEKRADGKENSSYSTPMAGRVLEQTTITKAAAAAEASVQLNWKAVTGADGYQIYRSSKKKSGYKRIATVSTGGTVTYRDAVPKTDTVYYYKIRAYAKSGGVTGYAGTSEVQSAKAVAVPAMKAVRLKTDGTLKISWNKVSGAVGYRLYKRAGTGSFKKEADLGENVSSYVDKSVISGINYEYRIQAYNKYNGVKGSSGLSKTVSYTILFYDIMGSPKVTTAQMIAYYNAMISSMQKAAPSKNYGYPAAVYAAKGAPDIDTFAKIVYEEATFEGVRPEVVFAQMCNETYFLQFDGDVKVDQCNFAGIGATGNGEPGLTFADVRTGIRAQVQHLKAYASTEALKYACVDPRFQYVKRETAKYVEWLGIQENPNTVFAADGTIASGCGWATAKNYGYILVSGINKIKTY